MHQPPLPPLEIFLVFISVRGRVDPRAIVQPERLCKWNFTDTIRNQTRNLPAHRAVFQPNAPHYTEHNLEAFSPTLHSVHYEHCTGYKCNLWRPTLLLTCFWASQTSEHLADVPPDITSSSLGWCCCCFSCSFKHTNIHFSQRKFWIQ